MSKLNQISTKTSLNIRGTLVNIEKPVVMGIINLTPDSFYKNSRAESLKAIIDKAGQMLEEGATFLDIGAFSTRPGALEVKEAEEIEQLLAKLDPILEATTLVSSMKRRVEVLRRVGVGKMAPDFTQKDPGGNPV